MKYVIPVILLSCLGIKAGAHEMVPAYPKFEQSFYENVLVTTMTLFNRRQDINYYEIEVLDEDWNPIKFASTSRVIEVEYLNKRNFDIYLKKRDLDKVEYICTKSKILKGQEANPVSSKICSRIK